ncbi:MAG: stage II sporulation protein R [Lachnospiraceae bacterium]|nr:stage II sporulation protein R [Lachnospiraceae bacterium]
MLHRKNKKENWILWIVCCLGITLIFIKVSDVKGKNLQRGIADEIIRFHVLADSDKEEDQQVKLKVKDQVVRYMQEKLVAAKDKKQARMIIKDNLEEIECLAHETLKVEGVKNEVRAYLTKKQFPVKSYGEFTFPEGIYETLQVEIGSAEGKNWWCVMFPSLCMIDESYTVVPDSAKEKLQENLTKEEYESLQEENKIEYKWKIAEWWKGIDYFF